MKRNKIGIIVLVLILIVSVSVACYPQITWDALPSVDDYYDVGSPSLRWQDGHYSGDIYIEGDIDSVNDDLIIDTGTGNTVVFEPPVWTDLSIAMAQARTPASLAPTWTPYKGSQVPAFSASQVNVLYFSAQLPHSYKEGTDLEFHIHIAYPDAVAGNSVWYFTYSWANVGDPFLAPSDSGQVIIASPGVADQHDLAELITVINGAGKTISSVLLCSIQRTGTHGDDNYGNVIYLVSGDFHFQMDTLGSRTELLK